MDTPNSIQLETTDGDAISCNLLKFANELSKNLESCNLKLEKSCLEGKERIEGLKANNIQLAKKIYQQNFDAGIFKDIDYMKDKTLNYAHNMCAVKKMIDAHMERQNEVFFNCKRYLEEQNIQKYDEYTMMPFHDIENEIEQLNIKVKQLNEGTAQIYSDAKTLCISMEKEYQKALQETEMLNIYHKEQRFELQHMKELSWENPILSKHLYEQKIAQLESEIVELETQIKDDTN